MKKIWINAVLGIILLAAGAGLVGMGAWLGQWYYAAPSALDAMPGVKAMVLARAENLPEFHLTTHKHEPFTLATFNRKWTFLFFGYTYCPDICPSALILLKDVYTDLEKHGDVDNAQVMFVSVDGKRDTPEQLSGYVPYFHPAFIGASGRKEEVDTLGKPLGVAYHVKEEGREANNYLIDHSASVYLIDPLGRLRAIFPPPHDPQVIVSDFRLIRNKYAEECCTPRPWIAANP